MIDSNNREEQREGTSFQHAARDELSRGVQAIGKSARQAERVIKTHPYFTAGILAGIGLTIAGALAIRRYGRRSFADVVLGWF